MIAIRANAAMFGVDTYGELARKPSILAAEALSRISSGTFDASASQRDQ